MTKDEYRLQGIAVRGYDIFATDEEIEARTTYFELARNGNLMPTIFQVEEIHPSELNEEEAREVESEFLEKILRQKMERENARDFDTYRES